MNLKQHFEIEGYKVYKGIIPAEIIDDINYKAHLLIPYRAHSLDQKYYPKSKVNECKELGIWWSQQIVDWQEVRAISKILLDILGLIFDEPHVYVADIISNEPNNSFVKPHIDSPYRFDQWHQSTELLGIRSEEHTSELQSH